MKKTIAIIHFNTPELTECCIMSIRKQGCDWPVVVGWFDAADGSVVDGTPLLTSLRFQGMVPVGVNKLLSIFIDFSFCFA